MQIGAGALKSRNLSNKKDEFKKKKKIEGIFPQNLMNV